MTQAVIKNEQREFSFSEDEFRFLAKLVGELTGIVLAEHKTDMVYSRLARRLRTLNLSSFAEYCDLLQTEEGQEEIPQLVNAITTNLTSFFREAHHFEHLRDTVLRPLAASPPSPKRLRLWSAGCSAGMEPYSIAMTLKSAIPNLDAWDARILATDIDTNMLRTGVCGEYPLSEFDHIPPSLRGDVQRSKERIRMSESLQKRITFNELNLLESWPIKTQFDAIFCRNVVIYFDKPTQQTLFSRLADHLKPGGWLYIGHSENLHNVCDRFELVGRTIYRRIR
ncbi:MAG: protein-glutamate O-methyltransferase [Alphaproteobacteria bacterium]|nr:protein-glutamate O-methyltransferase [Alphaproteobacteria bacterium]